MNVGWVGWMGIGMENESGSGARCEKRNVKNHFSEPNFLLFIDGGLVVYIYICIGTRASAYARGLLGEIIHRTYGPSGRHRVA